MLKYTGGLLHIRKQLWYCDFFFFFSKKKAAISLAMSSSSQKEIFESKSWTDV